KHPAQHRRQHVVGTHGAEGAVALGDRGAHRGDDVGVLNLFAHCLVLPQLRSGLPVSSMCAMRCWVFSVLSSSTNCARSTSRIHCSLTRRLVSTSPPHSAVAAALATR